MRKLEPIPDDPLAVYDEIIRRKDEADRLCRLKGRLIAAYQHYERKGHKLHRMTPLSGLYPKDRAALFDCYNAKIHVYWRIRKIAYWCPYCTLVQVQTLDHYLPKEDFPEFAVLTKNLVPSCRDCNTSGKKYEEDGRRALIHPYFDDIRAHELWTATVGVVDGVPEVKFDVDPGTNDGELCARHAENLKLKERFSAWAMEGGGLTPIINAIEDHDDRAEAREYLLEQARRELRDGTPNLARVALLRGAAASDELLAYCLEGAS